jgi:uncharacterized protein (TIGR03083 family)
MSGPPEAVLRRRPASRRRPPLVFDQAEVATGVREYGQRVAHLLGKLDSATWTTPTRCAGWQVCDVAGHLCGLFEDVAAGRLESQGRPEVTSRQAAALRGRPPAELAERITGAAAACAAQIRTTGDQAWEAPAPSDFPGPLRRAMLVLWYELYVHGDDIRAAIGASQDDGPGLLASVAHVCETLGLWGWGPATVSLDGLPELPVRGGGRRVSGAALPFLLAATGRLDPKVVGLDDRVNIYRSVTV